MRAIIELADGNLYGVDITEIENFDPTTERFYDWLNACEYTGCGEFTELTDYELDNIEQLKIITE